MFMAQDPQIPSRHDLIAHSRWKEKKKPSEGQSGVHLILDLNESIEHHGAASYTDSMICVIESARKKVLRFSRERPSKSISYET